MRRWFGENSATMQCIQIWQLEHSFSSKHSATIKGHKDEVQSKVSNACKERQKKKFNTLLAR